ncbi:hypothetical protein [Lysobacter tyrosinilyticus]
MIKALALSQAALNLAAKDPKNHHEMRQWRAQAIALRDQAVREHVANLARVNGFIERVGIALGEVAA